MGCGQIPTAQSSLRLQAGTRLLPPGTSHDIREHPINVRKYILHVYAGTRGLPVEYLLLYECVRTLRDVRMAYQGEYMNIYIFGDDFR